MPAKYAITDLVALPHSAARIPGLGFGVYRSESDVCTNSCLKALSAGYRHIDSAQYYANEGEVGEAVRRSQVARDSVFVTTKILYPGGSVEKSYQSIVESVEKFNLDGYVDLFLIHSPSSGAEGRKEMWQALEKALDDGKVRSIGVSNFGVGHIEELRSFAKVWPPHVNQIELHPWCQQRTINAYCRKHGIVVEAYSPLVRNQKADDATLNKLAKKYGKTTAQVLIRYCLQKEWVPLPKSDTPSRIEENAKVFDFDIEKEDMDTLDGLDQGDQGAIVCAVKN
ncbi:MAG: hypothetical protein M1816_001104 [Peltula sp. TS41687]|nr:MAG: hypothetical protein M1816_001104 [Peltula sp. TS41687]